MTRVCDWIAEYLYSIGVKRVHGLMGGGASGLNDGFVKHPNIDYICYHHEQGAGHAAIGESKYTGEIAVVNPTTGCGGTNCITSVLNAWQDGVPVIFISGNVRLDTCSSWINEQKRIRIRKYGIQEHNIIDTVKSITKYAEFVTNVDDVAITLQKAIAIAKDRRPGPVWIDIPGNIQTALMPKTFKPFEYKEESKEIDFTKILHKIQIANRPIVLAGYGIRQANVVSEFVEFIEKYKLPYVSTYGARDYTPHSHPLNIGAVGIKGSRAGNFAMQNCDTLLVLGSSLNSSVIGYDPKQFSPSSYKIYVDCDLNEHRKEIVHTDLNYYVTLKQFFDGVLQ